ncbi:MAG: hypothetical protein ACXIUW_12555 [Roseinatronobacter sp.]
MRLLFLFLPIFVAACNSPSPAMRGGNMTEVMIEGTRLFVWRKGSQVEVIRHGYVQPAKQAGLRARMLHAAALTTGCEIRPGTVEGDTGVMRASLNCDEMRKVPELAPDQ